MIPTEKPTAINPHSSILHIKGYTDNLPRYQTKRLNVKLVQEKNVAKEELLSLCQRVCGGQELSNGFISKLKKNNLELSEISHDLKELQASSQVPFNQLGQKLFRAIDNKEEKFFHDKPLVYTNPKILTEYYSTRSDIQKNYTQKHPETSQQTIDIKHKHETAYQTFHQPNSLNPLFSDSMFSVISPKRHLDIQSTKAMQNNGNIITWKNPKKIGDQKDVMKEKVIESKVRSNYKMSPSKLKSKFDFNHSEMFQTLPQSTRGKNMKDFQGNGDIISWNSTKLK